MFIDETEVEVQGGRGGHGSSALRREKYVPRGGPSGGDGGRGGSVVFTTHTGLSTLMDLKFRRHLRAADGENGRGKDQHGRSGRDLEVLVPVGTQIYDAKLGCLLWDLRDVEMRCVVAHGGRGGRGNKHFATAYNRAPIQRELGEDGEYRHLRLELKLLADVGILGFPNAGKSTFISKVSRAHPKIADYPFTTLVPQLGVVSLGDDRSFVIADVPGLIEGASQGAGLGTRFLRHLERTRALLMLVTLDDARERSPLEDYHTLLKELETYKHDLYMRPRVVALSQCDRDEVQQAYPDFEREMQSRGETVFSLSSVTGSGVQDVLLALERLVTVGFANEPDGK